MNKLSTLSPLRIKSAVYRAKFYQEIRKGSDDWDLYEVIEDEEKRPDIISYAYYGTIEAQRIVMIAGKVDNMINAQFEIGSTISLPHEKFIRERIRHYENLEAAIAKAT